MNELENAGRCRPSIKSFLDSWRYILTKVGFKFGIMAVIGVVFTSLGLCNAQETEQLVQSASLVQVISESYQPEIDGIVEEDEYPQKLELGRGRFIILWKNDHEFLYMALKAKTMGWLSIGFEATSRMKDADMIFGWVDDGQAILLDLYSTGSIGPHPPDEELGGRNDILEFEEIEENSYTTIEFKRKMNTGDKYDKVLLPGQRLNFIWAIATYDSFNSKHNILSGQARLTLEVEKVEFAQNWMDIELKDMAIDKRLRLATLGENQD